MSGSLANQLSFFPHLSLAAKPFDDSIQDGVLDHVLVDPFPGPRNGQLGDYSGQTQGGVVSQRHVADLQFRGKGRGEQRRSAAAQLAVGTVFPPAS